MEDVLDRATCSPYDWFLYIQVVTDAIPKVLRAAKFPITVVGGRAADIHTKVPTGSIDWDVKVHPSNTKELVDLVKREILKISDDIEIIVSRAVDVDIPVVQIFMRTCTIFDVIDIFEGAELRDPVEIAGIYYAPISNIKDSLIINANRHRERANEAIAELDDLKSTWKRKIAEFKTLQREANNAEDALREAIEKSSNSEEISDLLDRYMEVARFDTIANLEIVAKNSLMEQNALVRDLKQKAKRAEIRASHMK